MATSLHLRIVKHLEHANLCHMWVIGTEGPVEFGLLHGTVKEDRAELLAETLGLPVVRQDQPNPVIDGFVEAAAKRTEDQRELF